MDELSSQLKQLETFAGVSTGFLIELFKNLRKSNISRPDVVVKYGERVIAGSSDPEVWTVLEQVCIAALILHEVKLAERCLNRLSDQFSKSSRFVRLLGMRKESQDKYYEAIEIYDKILKETPADIVALKRKVCCYRALKDIPNVMKQLHYILKSVSMADAACWVELSELHIEHGDYPEAIHCLEELILIDPHNCHYYNRIGDVYYSYGGFDNLVKARKYYTISCHTQAPSNVCDNNTTTNNVGNMRGLIGLIFTCNCIMEIVESSNSSSSSSSSTAVTATAINDEKDITESLLRWGKDQLKAINSNSSMNKQHQPSITSLVASVLV